MYFSRKILMVSLLCIYASCNADAQRGGLSLDYYIETCPSVEEIVRSETERIMSIAPTLAAPLLRLHFHDCFVRVSSYDIGCDGSVLLNSTKNSKAEKDSPPNFTLRGYGSIERVKAAVEEKCPGVVSCADIVALVARDAVSILKGPYWKVPLGRRDGRISNASEALANIPAPTFNFTQLKASFAVKGLTSKDLVVLSGSHTIGTSHCSTIATRLYNFSGTGAPDPSMDPEYVARLKSRCRPTDNTTLVEMDPGSFRTFDLHYYENVGKRRGLFTSDSTLLSDGLAGSYVRRQGSLATAAEFFEDFSDSMVKLGSIGVLTGKEGEIRKRCDAVN
ncbi:hypothetical protein M569_11425 [Genlisea aurea]|uniref:Peroxidase n=1 Tax=Genlisea aurea TaxID=192259 RepID=S8C9C5_9LAMI|nr:hypothetical protein M569_11425 [Genlisea aurea]